MQTYYCHCCLWEGEPTEACAANLIRMAKAFTSCPMCGSYLKTERPNVIGEWLHKHVRDMETGRALWIVDVRREGEHLLLFCEMDATLEDPPCNVLRYDSQVSVI